MFNWPEWWEWELEITAHLEKRMLDRNFNEIDLRAMLEKRVVIARTLSRDDG